MTEYSVKNVTVEERRGDNVVMGCFSDPKLRNLNCVFHSFSELYILKSLDFYRVPQTWSSCCKM